MVTSILDERIANLREAIEEIDAALVGCKQLNVKFIEQIDREAERHLNTLQPPWKMGFYPEIEFLRLSLHKSLTSRAKERRGRIYCNERGIMFRSRYNRRTADHFLD